MQKLLALLAVVALVALTLTGCQEAGDGPLMGYYWVDGAYVPITAVVVHEPCVKGDSKHRFEGYALPQLMMVKVAVGPDSWGKYMSPDRVFYDGDTIHASCPREPGVETVFISSP